MNIPSTFAANIARFSDAASPTKHKQRAEIAPFRSPIDQYNDICEEAEDYIVKGDLEEAFHRYRACAFIMLKVHQNCPENYKVEAENTVKGATQRMRDINEKRQGMKTATQKYRDDTEDILTYLIGHEEVRHQIIKLLQRVQLSMHGLRSHDTTIFLYGASGCGKTHLAKSIAKAMVLHIMA